MSPRPIEPHEVIPERGSDAPRAELQTPELPQPRVHARVRQANSLDDVVIPEGRRYLTAREAAAYVRCRSMAAFYHWHSAHGLGKRPAPLRFTREELDRALQPKAERRYFTSHRRTA